jgi:hypothetical protein
MDLVERSKTAPDTTIYMDYGSEELANHPVQKDALMAMSQLLLKKNVNLAFRIIPGGNLLPLFFGFGRRGLAGFQLRPNGFHFGNTGFKSVIVQRVPLFFAGLFGQLSQTGFELLHVHFVKLHRLTPP